MFFFLIQVAVCNLASIALNMYVSARRTFDFNKLASVTKVIVKNLNKIIDINYYPVPEVCCDTCVATDIANFSMCFSQQHINVNCLTG